MDLEILLDHMDKGYPVEANTEFYKKMHNLSQKAMQITSKLNNEYNEPEEIRKLMSELTGKKNDETFSMFPPFYTDCGKNITIGKNVFINSGCRFQDQGGITIGDGSLIGHNVVMATLNHDFAPTKRSTLHPKPIKIGKNVWIGSNATILAGVTIEDGAIVGAGAVVSKNVQSNTIVAGVPAKFIRKINEEDLK